MIPEKMQELLVLLGLVSVNFNDTRYDLDKIGKRADKLLKEFLEPYKVETVNENATKVE